MVIEKELAYFLNLIPLCDEELWERVIKLPENGRVTAMDKELFHCLKINFGYFCVDKDPEKISETDCWKLWSYINQKYGDEINTLIFQDTMEEKNMNVEKMKQLAEIVYEVPYVGFDEGLQELICDLATKGSFKEPVIEEMPDNLYRFFVMILHSNRLPGEFVESLSAADIEKILSCAEGLIE